MSMHWCGTRSLIWQPATTSKRRPLERALKEDRGFLDAIDGKIDAALHADVWLRRTGHYVNNALYRVLMDRY